MTADESNSAEDALGRFAAGDARDEVFEQALPALEGIIRGYLLWFGVRREDLEDFAQEAVVRVYIYSERRVGMNLASLKGWVQALCRNLVIDSSRVVRPEQLASVTARRDNKVTDVMRHLEQCIAELREPDATVFRLRYDLGWSTARIAELFGWQLRNSELVLARARANVGLCLRGKGYDL